MDLLELLEALYRGDSRAVVRLPVRHHEPPLLIFHILLPDQISRQSPLHDYFLTEGGGGSKGTDFVQGQTAPGLDEIRTEQTGRETREGARTSSSSSSRSDPRSSPSPTSLSQSASLSYLQMVHASGVGGGGDRRGEPWSRGEPVKVVAGARVEGAMVEGATVEAWEGMRVGRGTHE